MALPGTIESFRARFAAARGSLPALEALNAELIGLKGDAFVDLQCDVMAEIQTMRGRGSGAATYPKLANDLVGLIKARGREEGQPLFRYGVTDDEYAGLRERLEYLHERRALENANERSAATFVIYVSEWFRREYDGAGQRWIDPHPEIIGSLPYGSLTSLSREGLAWWGRQPRRS